MIPRHAELIGRARAVTDQLPPGTDAASLFLLAADVALARFDEPLGSALAAVLVTAADRRQATGLPGVLGESVSMLALAAVVTSSEFVDTDLAAVDGPD